MDIVSAEGHCTFGNFTTEVLGGNEFRYPLDSHQTLVQIPFGFAWMVSTFYHFGGWGGISDFRYTCKNIFEPRDIIF